MFDEYMVLITNCISCGTTLVCDPETVPSVWVNDETRCPVRPDGTQIVPGEVGTTKEAVCDACEPKIRAAIDIRTPVLELFPYARMNRIRPAGRPESDAPPQ